MSRYAGQKTKFEWVLGEVKIHRLPRRRRGYLDFPTIKGGTPAAGLWEIVPSQHCVRFAIVRVTPNSRADRLIQAMGGIWVQRDNGWRVLPSCAEEFQRLYALGWDTSLITGQLMAPRR